MQKKIIVGADEYKDAEKALKKASEELLTQIDAHITSLKSLVSEEGGFYVESIAEKVSLLVGELNDIRDTLSENFDEVGKVMNAYAASIEDIDASS